MDYRLCIDLCRVLVSEISMLMLLLGGGLQGSGPAYTVRLEFPGTLRHESQHAIEGAARHCALSPHFLCDMYVMLPCLAQGAET